MNLKSVLETIIFVHGEPISLEKLSRLTGVKEEEVKNTLEELKNDFVNRGIILMENDGQYQLGSNPENFKYIEDLVKSEFTEELTKAAVEVLAIIAYKGPLTRAEIEYIRGVNSSFTLRNLMMRGLIEKVDNPKDARSYLYRTSFDFLKYLGLSRPEDLPRYEEFKKESVEISPDGSLPT